MPTPKPTSTIVFVPTPAGMAAQAAQALHDLANAPERECAPSPAAKDLPPVGVPDSMLFRLSHTDLMALWDRSRRAALDYGPSDKKSSRAKRQMFHVAKMLEQSGYHLNGLTWVANPARQSGTPALRDDGVLSARDASKSHPQRTEWQEEALDEPAAVAHHS